ncbi:hypothetical protein CAP36_14480 [Chitinophagaceae bacterium IBVUCB2]|nr:hypothetical protein CAP36_14480 [Chitinophagaceae bacterium IBVUCB2]
MKIAVLLAFLITSSSLLYGQEKTFEKTLESINKRLDTWQEWGNLITVSATRNGNIIVSNERNAIFPFNLFDLLPLPPGKPAEQSGIELEPCDKKVHAPLSWINFKTENETVAFIRLACDMPLEELLNVYNDFVLLKSFCTKEFY